MQLLRHHQGPPAVLGVPAQHSRSRFPSTLHRAVQRDNVQGPLDDQTFAALRGATLAVGVVCLYAASASEARPADAGSWVPRRHHRHIGERFTDTWADSIVEVSQCVAAVGVLGQEGSICSC